MNYFGLLLVVVILEANQFVTGRLSPLRLIELNETTRVWMAPHQVTNCPIVKRVMKSNLVFSYYITYDVVTTLRLKHLQTSAVQITMAASSTSQTTLI